PWAGPPRSLTRGQLSACASWRTFWAGSSTAFIHEQSGPGSTRRPAYPRSLPNTKLAEDQVQQIFGRGFADDLADRIDGDAQVQGHQLQRGLGAQGLQRAQGRLARALQSVLVTRIDQLQHVGFDVARPHQRFDGVLERLDPFAAEAAHLDRR